MNGLNIRIVLWTLGVLLAGTGQAWAQTYTPAEAAAFHLPNFTYETLPTPGIYQDVSQRGSGRGWSVDASSGLRGVGGLSGRCSRCRRRRSRP